MGSEDPGRIVAQNANGVSGRGRPPRQQYIDNSERDADIATDYYVYRMTQADICEKYGLTQSRISQILLKQRQRGMIDPAELRARSQEVLQEIQRRQLAIASLMPGPVTAGKDGTVVYDPETGEVVRDYAAPLRALADAVKTDDALARRFGLDAASKAEVQTTVRYSVEGLETGDLT